MPTAENDEQRGKRRLLARVVLILGLAAVFFVLLPALPHEQHVVFRFHPADGVRIRRVEVSWVSEDESELFGGFSSEFPHGAPPILERTMSLPNGRYEFSIRVSMVTSEGDGTVTITRTRRTSLEGGETTLLLKDLAP